MKRFHIALEVTDVEGPRHAYCARNVNGILREHGTVN